MATFRVALADGVITRVSPRGYDMPRVSPSGKWALLASPRLFLEAKGARYCVLDLTTGRLSDVDAGERELAMPSFGVRDEVIVFSRRARSKTTADVYALEFSENADSVIRQWCVVRDTAPCTRPHVSPDGRIVAYIADPGYPRDDLDVFAVRLHRLCEDGETATVYEADAGERVSSLRWFPDGRRLLLHTSSAWRILDVTSGECSDYTGFLRDQGHLDEQVILALGPPVPCPDGSDRMAMSMVQTTAEGLSRHYIAVMDFDGSELTQVTFDADQPIPYVFREQQQEFILGNE